MIQFNFNGQDIQMEQDPNSELMNMIFKECSQHFECISCKAKTQGLHTNYGVAVCQNCDLFKQGN